MGRANGKVASNKVAELVLQPFCHFTYVAAHSPTLPSLRLRHSSFSNSSVALPMSQLILQPFCFTYVTAHSPTFLLLLLRHRLFTYVTWIAAYELKLKFCHIYRATSFDPHVLILNRTMLLLVESLQHVLCYELTAVCVCSLYCTQLCSFSNLSVTSPTSQLILQPFRRFTYVTTHSPTLPLLHLRHSSFSNPSFASPTSQALHLIHLASRPCFWFFFKALSSFFKSTRFCAFRSCFCVIGLLQAYILYPHIWNNQKCIQSVSTKA